MSISVRVDDSWHSFAYRQKWKSDLRLNSADRNVIESEFVCRLLQAAMVFDQIDLTNLASFGILVHKLHR